MCGHGVRADTPERRLLLLLLVVVSPLMLLHARPHLLLVVDPNSNLFEPGEILVPTSGGWRSNTDGRRVRARAGERAEKGYKE